MEVLLRHSFRMQERPSSSQCVARGQAAQHRREVVFARGVEAAGLGRVFLADQAIGADDERLAVLVEDRAVDDEKMVAEIVEAVEVAPLRAHLRRRDRRHLFVEDAVAQTLRRLDLGFGLGQTDLERAGDGQDRPALRAAFERTGLVDVDQAFLPALYAFH